MVFRHRSPIKARHWRAHQFCMPVSSRPRRGFKPSSHAFKRSLAKRLRWRAGYGPPAASRPNGGRALHPYHPASWGFAPAPCAPRKWPSDRNSGLPGGHEPPDGGPPGPRQQAGGYGTGWGWYIYFCTTPTLYHPPGLRARSRWAPSGGSCSPVGLSSQHSATSSAHRGRGRREAATGGVVIVTKCATTVRPPGSRGPCPVGPRTLPLSLGP